MFHITLSCAANKPTCLLNYPFLFPRVEGVVSGNGNINAIPTSYKRIRKLFL